MPLFEKRMKVSGKEFPVCVTSMDAELEFNLHLKATGQELFDLVCRTIGLREVWYFGLQYVDNEGFVTWLNLKKRVREQKIHKKGLVKFLFLAKFYPEDIAEELVQDITRHLFFLQMKQAILNMDIYCQPEASVLLASYAVQAKYGDYDETSYKPELLADEDLLPQTVIDKFEMTPEMWVERVKMSYVDHRGMTCDEAELEYLKIVQDFDMYGVNYFHVSNKGDELWVGVTALGVNIYEMGNKLSPELTFLWSEIQNISFYNKKITLKLVDRSLSSFQFYSSRRRLNKLILDLCIGNHSLFLCRRKPDSMEIQQMKAQAKEQKARRQMERNKLAHEKQLREKIEKEKADLMQRLIQYQEETRVAYEALRRSEETAELLAEKAHVVEEEAMLLAQKASEISTFQTEDEKKLEVKMHEAASKLIQESEPRDKKTEKLKEELIKTNLSDISAKEKLQQLSKGNYFRPYISNKHVAALDIVSRQHSELLTEHFIICNNNTVNYNVIKDQEMEELTQEIEKEKTEYFKKSKHLHKQLLELKTEIDVLKMSDNITFC